MRVLVAALMLTLLGPVQVAAQQPGRQVAVPYADLDLRSASGVHTLDRRLHKAIRTLCAEKAGSPDLRESMAARECVRVKTAELIEQRNHAVALKASRSALAQ